METIIQRTGETDVHRRVMVFGSITTATTHLAIGRHLVYKGDKVMDIKFSKTQIKQLKWGIAHRMGFAPESILIDEFCKSKQHSISTRINIKYAICGWVHIQTKMVGDAEFRFDSSDFRKSIVVYGVDDCGHTGVLPDCDKLTWIKEVER